MSVRIALAHYAHLRCHFSFKTSVFNTIRDFTANRKNIMLIINDLSPKLSCNKL